MKKSHFRFSFYMNIVTRRRRASIVSKFNGKKRHKLIILVMALVLIPLLILVFPLPRFDAPTSTVVFSNEGELLGARIAADGQWRFPPAGSIPEKYKKALLAFEDQWFYYHPGINPVSLGRALLLNIKNRKIVSGGSTISMQVARLSRQNPPRNIASKILEMGMALKMELFKSKNEILLMYASSAPFGGNVVGIDVAAWRYFGRPADELSWAESATLAVLPNAPSLVYPGQNSATLKSKRDFVLNKLLENENIDSLTYSLSLSEPLPAKPKPLPQLAFHAVEQIAAQHEGQRVQTSINKQWQAHVNKIVTRHHGRLAQNNINNLAVLIVEVETAAVKTWVGNVPGLNNQHSGYVDLVTAPRSTGSILKPFLYASMLQYGEMLPNTLVRDLPVNFSGYAPKNFDYTYSGAVPASKALSRSLNIPAVEMLYRFGEARFLDVLRGLGFTSFTEPAEHYGLSLILGGGETSLLELAGAYASMARTLNYYYNKPEPAQFTATTPTLAAEETNSTRNNKKTGINASSAWFTLNALQQVNRPEGRAGWWNFSSSDKLAWKTGTSFGFRDAWAVGTTPEYVVAVWVGNADGEGRAGLTGTKAAAPVLFDILDFLPRAGWFAKPTNNITEVEICSESGYKASPFCPNKKLSEIPRAGLQTSTCPYHKMVHLSADKQWQVNASCYQVDKMVHEPFFVLPPGMEWYYRKIHPEYRMLPPLHTECGQPENTKMMELLYPRSLSKLYVPRDLDGTGSKIVFEAAHRHADARLFWHLDNDFVGETSHFHQMGLAPNAGKHTLTIIDEAGNSLSINFNVMDR
ncbi:MAG: penicillin-binding protein 1C [Prolixibacteraceae bacterium]|nr:penicillin-binding protein 1C [Prolixibacteraceae bacterium]